MAESEFMTSDLDINKNTPADMTFRDLYSHFLEYQDDKVRLTTKRNYEHKITHLESFMDVKCKDFNIVMYTVLGYHLLRQKSTPRSLRFVPISEAFVFA